MMRKLVLVLCLVFVLAGMAAPVYAATSVDPIWPTPPQVDPIWP